MQLNIQIGGDNHVLRKKSTTVSKIDKQIQELAHSMIDYMWDHNGVGLAAPQVGFNKRLFVVTQWDTSKDQWEFVDEIVMINPQILEVSKELILDEEGCLSIPGKRAKIMRPSWVKVEYTDLSGRKLILKSYGFNARIILHEFDHLDGVLYIDKVHKPINMDLNSFIIQTIS